MVAGLDSWQAMELDMALAVKYSTLEEEKALTQLEVLVASIDNVVRAQGAKLKKRKPRTSLIRPYSSPDEAKAIDDLPLLSDVLEALGSGTTIVNTEGLEEYNGR